MRTKRGFSHVLKLNLMSRLLQFSEMESCNYRGAFYTEKLSILGIFGNPESNKNEGLQGCDFPHICWTMCQVMSIQFTLLQLFFFQSSWPKDLGLRAIQGWLHFLFSFGIVLVSFPPFNDTIFRAGGPPIHFKTMAVAGPLFATRDGSLFSRWLWFRK